jgi:peptidoglycan/LPS O-acetylase OafA/YrhL
MSRHSSQHQIIGIDLVRFSAAFMVMMHHLGFMMWAGQGRSTAFRAAGATAEFQELAFFGCGRVGVEIFFVVSGFVIAYSAQRASAYEFFRSRVVRLVPAVWLIAPISLTAAYLVDFAPQNELMLMFHRTVSFFPRGPFIDSVYWTLGIEISFYALVFALLLIDRVRWLPAVIAVIGLSSSAFWLATALGFPHTIRIPGLLTLSGRWLELILVDHGCFFAFGVFLWLSLLKEASAVRCGFMACFAVGGLISIWMWSFDYALNAAVPCAAWILSVVVIILSVWGNRFLQANKRFSKAARVLGLTTYPLYLLHNLVGGAVFGWLFRMGTNKYGALLGALGTVLALALAIAVILEPRLQAGLRFCIDRITIAIAQFGAFRMLTNRPVLLPASNLDNSRKTLGPDSGQDKVDFGRLDAHDRARV